MIKALLIDADGVALQKQEYFSDRYAKDYNVPIEKIVPFFKSEFRDCQLGKADVKEVLPKYLKEWGWQGSVDTFLDYWFSSSTIADEVVLRKIEEIRATGVKCYLATDQEHYRAEYTRKALGFDDKFDGCFFSYELSCSKSQPEFFSLVIQKLGLPPDEILYFDDEVENVEVAKKLGLGARLYSGINDFDLYLNNGDVAWSTLISHKAMDIVVGYEIKNAREAAKVYKDGVGYDIRSIDVKGQERLIEVKGVSESWKTYTWQPLYTTEVDALRKSPEKFYLYIVYFDITPKQREKVFLENAKYTLFTINGTALLKQFTIKQTYSLTPISQRKLKPFLVESSTAANLAQPLPSSEF